MNIKRLEQEGTALLLKSNFSNAYNNNSNNNITTIINTKTYNNTKKDKTIINGLTH